MASTARTGFHSRGGQSRACCRVGDGEGERVGGVGRGRGGEPEHDADHLGDLGLVGAAAARHRPLHARRRVLERPRAPRARTRAAPRRARDRAWPPPARPSRRRAPRRWHRRARARARPRRARARWSTRRIAMALVSSVCDDRRGRRAQARAAPLDDAPAEVARARDRARATITALSPRLRAPPAPRRRCRSRRRRSARRRGRRAPRRGSARPGRRGPMSGFLVFGTDARLLDLTLMPAFSSASSTALSASGGVVSCHSSPASA